MRDYIDNNGHVWPRYMDIFLYDDVFGKPKKCIKDTIVIGSFENSIGV